MPPISSSIAAPTTTTRWPRASRISARIISLTTGLLVQPDLGTLTIGYVPQRVDLDRFACDHPFTRAEAGENSYRAFVLPRADLNFAAFVPSTAEVNIDVVVIGIENQGLHRHGARF